MLPLFATSYFPPINYIAQLIKHSLVCMEAHEHFPKQSFRNRCAILNSNGVQQLSIPLIQTHIKILTGDVEISYAQNWKANHWRSIQSAYNRSAYFEFYKDELHEIFFTEEKKLLAFNNILLKWILQQIKVIVEINCSENFLATQKTANDFRHLTDKIASGENIANAKQYAQVFSYKSKFVENLSILDLLFNLGPDATFYLKNI